MKTLRAVLLNFISVAILMVASQFSAAQTDHAKHHPKKQSSAGSDPASMTPNANPSDSNKGMAGGKTGGMAEGMGDMMKEMMSPTGKAPKEIYPSLMQLADLSSEKIDEIKQLANAQIIEGNALMNIGLRKLSGATRRQDREAMLEATEQIQRGQILLESGLEGQRALAENNDPRVTALQWFNREMNLPSSGEVQPHGFFGLSWFHYIVMLMLGSFAAFMIWMYFHKMQRANALMLKLTGGSTDKIPPPGDAKPAAGKSEPAAKGAVAKPGQVTNGSPPQKGEAKPDASKPVVATTDMPPSKPNAFKGVLLASEIFDETPNVKTFRLTDPAGGKLPFNYLPGQFISLTVFPNGVPIRRDYTMASSPTHRDYCEITVKHEERLGVSNYLHTKVHEGELLQLTAPSGKFTFTEHDGDSIVLIAGGVGITPFMSTIRYLTDRSWKKDIYLLFSCKNENGIIFHEELGYLQKRYPNLHVMFVLSQPDKPNDAYITGRITKEVITNHVPEIATRRIHICGPEPMMDAVKQMLNELEVPKENVKTELFSSAPDASPQPPKGGSNPTDKASTELAPPKDEVVKSDAKEEVGNSEVPVESPAEPTPSVSEPEPEENGKAPPAAASESAGTAVATFARSNKTAVLTADKSILEASEDIGVNIDYQCRVGTCGICKTNLISGNVTMAVEDALTEDDKAQNVILACQAKATEDVSVDA